MKKNTRFKFGFVGCLASDLVGEDKYYYWDELAIYDKEEYEEFKVLYNQWKKLYR